MKYKRYISLIITFIMCLSITACRAGNSAGRSIDKEKLNEEVLKGNNKFTFNLFKELSKEDNGENLFISPISILTALTMTYNGADNNTKTEMGRVLGYEGIDINEVNNTYKELMNYIENIDKRVEINMGNSIWIKEGENIEENFISINKEVFKATVSELDFTKEGTTDTINNWISKETDGNIKDMLKGPIDKNVIMYLINAIYFNGDWEEPFNEKLTFQGEFTTSKGEKLLCDFMQKKGEEDKTYYGEGNNFQAIKLPYGSGKVVMYVVLPNEKISIDSFIEGLNEENWQDIKESIDVNNKQSINVYLPKFQMEYGVKELNQVLMNLGMEEAFDERADFSKIRKEICIDKVLHKAKIEVDEKGTTAAAATIVSMKECAAIENSTEFRANRPFLFTIVDEESDIILFMGKAETIKK